MCLVRHQGPAAQAQRDAQHGAASVAGGRAKHNQPQFNWVLACALEKPATTTPGLLRDNALQRLPLSDAAASACCHRRLTCCRPRQEGSAGGSRPRPLQHGSCPAAAPAVTVASPSTAKAGAWYLCHWGLDGATLVAATCSRHLVANSTKPVPSSSPCSTADSCTLRAACSPPRKARMAGPVGFQGGGWLQVFGAARVDQPPARRQLPQLWEASFSRYQGRRRAGVAAL